jgi:outer membrane protein assembly factor BamE
VVDELVALPSRHLALELLDFLVGEFHHGAGFEADHVIVVWPDLELEDRMPAGEVMADDQAHLLELREYAIDGGEADILAGSRQPAVQLFGTDMLGSAFAERFEDPQSRPRRLEPGVPEILPLHHLGSAMMRRDYPPATSLRPVTTMQHSVTTRRKLLAVLLAGAVAGGCVFRVDVQQGNLLDEADIEAVQPGMTRSQVRFLLGTPVVEDPFHQDRWDYMYYLRVGRSRKPIQRWLIVEFDGDIVRTLRKDVPIG